MTVLEKYFKDYKKKYKQRWFQMAVRDCGIRNLCCAYNKKAVIDAFYSVSDSGTRASDHCREIKTRALEKLIEGL